MTQRQGAGNFAAPACGLLGIEAALVLLADRTVA
jgi:hypothetical protein